MRALVTRVLYPLIEARLARRFTIRGAARQELTNCVQDVLVHLLERDAGVLRRWDRQRGSLAAYVSTVADHVAISSLRRKPPPTPMADPDAEQAPDSGPEAKASFAELVRGLLAKLSDSDAALFRAVYLEGLSPNEIADRLGISREATFKRVRRLRTRLQDHVSILMASTRTGQPRE